MLTGTWDMLEMDDRLGVSDLSWWLLSCNIPTLARRLTRLRLNDIPPGDDSMLTGTWDT